MKTNLLIPVFLVCLLPACSNIMNSHAMDVDLTVQHEALIRHFEEEAKQIQIMIDEHKKLLSLKSYVYGRHAEDLKTHSEEVIDLYEKAVVTNREMADLFRDMNY